MQLRIELPVLLLLEFVQVVPSMQFFAIHLHWPFERDGLILGFSLQQLPCYINAFAKQRRTVARRMAFTTLSTSLPFVICSDVALALTFWADVQTLAHSLITARGNLHSDLILPTGH